MNVLIVGSSGFVGRAFLDSMKKTQHQVVALYRSNTIQSSSNIFPANIDFKNKENIRTVLRNIDVVVYLAWDYSQYFEKVSEPKYSANIESLQSLLYVMEEQQIRRMIFVSALHAKEHSSNPYLVEKYRSECLILNSSIREKIILKVDVIWKENEDYFLDGIRKLLRFRFYPILSEKSVIYPIHINDFVEMLIFHLEKAVGWPTIIEECVGSDSLKICDIFAMVAKSMGRGFKVPVKGILARYYFELINNVSALDCSKQFAAWYGACSALSSYCPDFQINSFNQKSLLQNRFLSEV